MGSGPGYGRWTGLRGNEASVLGVAVYPLAPNVPSVSARVQRGASLLRWRRPIPNAAPRPVSFANVSPSVRRRRGTGLEKACGRSVWRRLGPQKPRRSTPPSLPVSARRPRVKSRRGGEMAALGIHPQGSRSADLRVQAPLRGVNGPACRGPVSWWRWFSPLATRAESSDRRVSGPSVERARLRGRGGSGSLYRRCWPVR